MQFAKLGINSELSNTYMWVFVVASPLAPLGLIPTPTGLTPSPSPKGEGSDVPCEFNACW